MTRVPDHQQSAENRKYHRLKTAFSIEYTIVRLPDGLVGIDWQKGVTRNVSQGGLCLETKDLEEKIIRYIATEDIYLELRVNVPLVPAPVRCICQVAWYQNVLPAEENHYLIGLKYRNISIPNLKLLMSYATGMSLLSRYGKILWPLAVAALGIIGYFYLFNR